MKTWKLFTALFILAGCTFAAVDPLLYLQLTETKKRRKPVKNFIDADTNRNGIVSREEFMTQRKLWAERKKAPFDEKQAEKIFLKKDANRNGELTPMEYRLR